MQIEQLLAWKLQMKAVAEENEAKREAGIYTVDHIIIQKPLAKTLATVHSNKLSYSISNAYEQYALVIRPTAMQVMLLS
jgi:hypothetical protein